MTGILPNVAAGTVDVSVYRFGQYTTPLTRTLTIGAGNVTNDYVLTRLGIQGVVRMPDGSPAPSVDVLTVLPNVVYPNIIHSLTDANGRYELFGFQEGTSTVHFIPLVGGDDALVGHHTVDLVDGDLKTIDITLPKAGRIQGVVRAPNGKPVADAEVMVEALGKYVLSDAFGRYDLTRFSATGPVEVTIRPPAGKGFATTHVMVEVTVGETTVQDLRLRKAGKLEGKVKLPNGRPAPDIQVSIGALTTRTDRHGKYQFDEVDLGTFSVVFQPTGSSILGGQVDNVVITEGRKSKVDFTLLLPGSVRVRLVDPLGEPVAGWVCAGFCGTTNDAGEFLAEGLRPGVTTISAWSYRWDLQYTTIEVPVVSGQNTDITITLRYQTP